MPRKTSARACSWKGGAGVWQARYGIALAMVPALLVVALLLWMLDGPLYGLPGLLFDIAVLVYAWGPRDLDVDVEAVIDAHDAPARRTAIARLGLTGEAAALDGPALVEAVFVNALQRWFGVLFWFLLLGPVGAVLYRLSVLATQDEWASTLPDENRLGARAGALPWPRPAAEPAVRLGRADQPAAVGGQFAADRRAQPVGP